MTSPLATSLSTAARSAIGAALLDVHTAQPGLVKSYDADNQVADVQPLLQRVLPARDDEDEDATEAAPILTSVPVIWPRVGSYFLHMPLEAGDYVLLIFSEGDTNNVRKNGETSRPGTVRRHGMSGAAAIPGWFVRDNPLAVISKLQIGRIGGPTIDVDASTIDVGGAQALAEHPNLDQHLTLIAQALDSLVSIATAGGTTAEPNYGVAAKGIADGLYPIATTVTRGT